MIIEANDKSYFVFDLDDTLYSEIDFVKSSFKYIASTIEPDSYLKLYEEMLHLFTSGGNPFNYIVEMHPYNYNSIEKLLYIYRNHFPDIYLKEGVLDMLVRIKSKKCKTGLITNGRSKTQRNKIDALGLNQFFDHILISEEFGFEKPNEEVFRFFSGKDEKSQFIYFGDNLKIDFITPKRLGWYCIGIIDENNIHVYNVNDFSEEYLPHIFIDKFKEIEIIWK